jgi:predicted dehydrogenase
MKQLRVGIVGTGGMGAIHAAAYMRNPDVKVVGVCSISRNLAEEFACGNWGKVSFSEGELQARSLYQIERVYDDYLAMASDPDIDAVSVVTPNVLHHPITMQMLRSNKHVLVEKPLAVNAVLAAEMVSTARDRSLVLATDHMWRYHDDVQFVRQIIHDGLIGKVIQTKSYGLHLRWGPDGWFADREQAGGGALIDMGVHAIDTTRYILGEPVVRSLYAAIGTRFRSISVDDSGFIMATFEDGTVSTFESGWNYPYISGVEASTEVWGTKGYVRLFPTELKLDFNGVWGTFKPERTESHTSTAPYQRQIDDFVAAIRGCGSCRTAYDVGLEVMRIVDAAYLSSADNKVISL